MPLQYRRLTAHLQTPNAMFNNRLSAYLTTHVGMRDLLQQTINESYNQQQQQQTGNCQFPPQQMLYPSPMSGYGQSQMMQPPHSPNMYRQAPYPPRPQQQAMQQAHHQRSASIATPQELTGRQMHSPVVQADNGRRMSMPAVQGSNTSGDSPVQMRTPTSATSTTPQPQPQPRRTPSFPPGSFSAPYMKQEIKQEDQPIQYEPAILGNDANATTNSYYPFTTTLGQDAQSLLAFDSSFPGTMMNNDGTLAGNFYDFSNDHRYSSTSHTGKQQTHPSYTGLTSTLAPSASDMSILNAGFDVENNNSTYFQDALKAGSSGITPAGTPGINDNAWASFFDADAWDQPAPQPS